MPIFQYPGLVEPLLPIAPADSPPLAWLPIYPDQVPHTKPRQETGTVLLERPPSTTEVRVTQAPVELLIQYAAPLTRVTQEAVEVIFQYSVRRVRITQLAVEIIYPFGCYTFVPGPPAQPASCPVDRVPDPNTAPCADDAPMFP